MKLSKLKLKNYRCFGSEEQVILIDQLTTFIGNNSTGKTAALSAINCMFSENSNDRILHRSDFHLPPNILPDEVVGMDDNGLESTFNFSTLISSVEINIIKDDDYRYEPSIVKTLLVNQLGGANA